MREQRSKRDAMAAPRATWESVHRTTECIHIVGRVRLVAVKTLKIRLNQQGEAAGAVEGKRNSIGARPFLSHVER